jgi:hypothetical protein
MLSTVTTLVLPTFVVMVYLISRRGLSCQSHLCSLALYGFPSIPDLVTLFMIAGQIVFGKGRTHNNYAALLLAIVPFAFAAEVALDSGCRTDIVLLSLGGWGGLLSLLAMQAINTDIWLLLVPVGYIFAMTVLIMSPSKTTPSDALFTETGKAFVYTMLWATSPEIANLIGVSDDLRLLIVLAIVVASTRVPLLSWHRVSVDPPRCGILMVSARAPISQTLFGLILIGQIFSLLLSVSHWKYHKGLLTNSSKLVVESLRAKRKVSNGESISLFQCRTESEVVI